MRERIISIVGGENSLRGLSYRGNPLDTKESSAF